MAVAAEVDGVCVISFGDQAWAEYEILGEIGGDRIDVDERISVPDKCFFAVGRPDDGAIWAIYTFGGAGIGVGVGDIDRIVSGWWS